MEGTEYYALRWEPVIFHYTIAIFKIVLGTEVFWYLEFLLLPYSLDNAVERECPVTIFRICNQIPSTLMKFNEVWFNDTF